MGHDGPSEVRRVAVRVEPIRAFGAVRVSAALLGIVLAGAWFLERTTLIDSDPFASVSTALIDHPFAVAAAFALLAAAMQYLPGPRATSRAISR